MLRRRNNRPRTILGTFFWGNIGILVGRFIAKVMICAVIMSLIPFIKSNITYAIETRRIELEEQKIEEQRQKDIIAHREQLKAEERERQRQEMIKKEQEKQREKERANKRFKVGDRIKILDYNWMIEEGDGYRFSVGMIDTVEKVEDGYIYLSSSKEKYYANNEFIQKVQSKREWRDLVNMQMKGQLKFHEEVE